MENLLYNHFPTFFKYLFGGCLFYTSEICVDRRWLTIFSVQAVISIFHESIRHLEDHLLYYKAFNFYDPFFPKQVTS